MPSRKIVTIDKQRPFLETPSEPVKKINREIKLLIQDIKDTINDPKVPAVGLAAVQIGVHKRIFGARMGYHEEQTDEEMQEPTIFINPEILEHSETQKKDFDACLSIPGMMGYSNRWERIKLRYVNEQGQLIEREFEGWDARAIQHETDHLNGILFFERLESYDDLYVYVKNAKGEREAVPYKKVFKQVDSSEKPQQPAPSAQPGAANDTPSIA